MFSGAYRKYPTLSFVSCPIKYQISNWLSVFIDAHYMNKSYNKTDYSINRKQFFFLCDYYCIYACI